MYEKVVPNPIRFISKVSITILILLFTQCNSFTISRREWDQLMKYVDLQMEKDLSSEMQVESPEKAYETKNYIDTSRIPHDKDRYPFQIKQSESTKPLQRNLRYSEDKEKYEAAIRAMDVARRKILKDLQGNSNKPFNPNFQTMANVNMRNSALKTRADCEKFKRENPGNWYFECQSNFSLNGYKNQLKAKGVNIHRMGMGSRQKQRNTSRLVNSRSNSRNGSRGTQRIHRIGGVRRQTNRRRY